MSRRIASQLAALILLAGVFSAHPAQAQQPTSQDSAQHSSLPSSLQEFPVTLRQKVEAGKTPVGTKIEARLTLGTLVSGKVIPEGAIFTGEVVESVAKSADGPSRLSIRMDSAHWKDGSISLTTYLTRWYYPIHNAALDDLANEPPGTMGQVGRHGGPGGAYPPPYPGGAGPNGSSDGSTLSDHRVEMKDVESQHASDGALALTSTHSNLKLDKTTTYVLATGDLSKSK